MQKLDAYFDTSETDPLITEAITTMLNRWRRQQNIITRHMEPHIIAALKEQQTVGFQNLLEGLPTCRWRKIQHLYYRQHNIRKSSRRWIRNLLKQLHALAWNQWNHRNEVKHRIAKPRHKKAMRLLRQEILREYALGARTLRPSDRHHLQHNVIDILNKSVGFQQAWLLNVTKSRQRTERIRTNNPTLDTTTDATQELIQWMQGRPR